MPSSPIISSSTYPQNNSSCTTAVSHGKKKPLLSLVKKGVVAVAYAVADVAGFIILGLALSAICPPLALPLYVFAATTVITKLVLLATKAIDPYHVRRLNKLKKAANKLVVLYPKLQLIALLFSLAISVISQSTGGAIAGLLGVLNGILIESNPYNSLEPDSQYTQGNLLNSQRNALIDS